MRDQLSAAPVCTNADLIDLIAGSPLSEFMIRRFPLAHRLLLLLGGEEVGRGHEVRRLPTPRQGGSRLFRRQDSGSGVLEDVVVADPAPAHPQLAVDGEKLERGKAVGTGE